MNGQKLFDTFFVEVFQGAGVERGRNTILGVLQTKLFGFGMTKLIYMLE